MTWLTWRQFRTQAITVYAGIVVLAIFLAATWRQLLRLTQGDPDLALRDISDAQAVIYLVSAAVVVLIPAIIGAFWGAPLVTRELEAGTHRLVWNQSVTRTRWLAVKLGLIGATAMAAAALVSLAVTWWAGPIDRLAELVGDSGLPTRISPLLFDSRGVAPAGYAAFAFVLGVTIGVLVRRTVPAMALTLALFTVVQIAVPLWVRPYVLPPVQQTAAITEITQIGRFEWQLGEVLVIEAATPSGAWVHANEILDPSGRAVDNVPPGVGDCDSPDQGMEPESQNPEQRCLDSLADLGYRQHVVYHPASSFWALSWAETGVYLLLSLLLAGVCFRWTRHRLS
jgi:hypothetical protein